MLGGSIHGMRTLTRLASPALPGNVKATRVRIPIDTSVFIESVNSEPGFIKAEWLVDSDCDSSKDIVLYFHGGGYTTSSAKSHRNMTSMIAMSSKKPVLSVCYRLAPEHKFPIALIDAISAFNYLLQSNHEPCNIILAGDSAGGGLAICLAFWLGEQFNGLKTPKGIITMSPWLDLTHSLPSVKRNSKYDWLPKANNKVHYYVGNQLLHRHPLVSPLFASEKIPLPPTLIHVGTHEQLRDEAIAFSLKHDNVYLELYNDQIHTFQVFGDKLSEISVERLGAFTNEPFLSNRISHVQLLNDDLQLTSISPEQAYNIIN